MDIYNQLVEAKLISISASIDQHTVEVKFIDNLKNNWKLCALGVNDLLVTDFLLNNIVDSVSIFDPISESHDDLAKKVFFIMRRKEPSEADYQWGPFKEKFQEVISGHLKFLEIEAVYGAQAMCLAREIELHEG